MSASMLPTAPIRVLIADDIPELRTLLRTTLQGRGFQLVGEAGDGRETLALAVDREPDVVVLDLGMPGVDGYGVVTRLRRENGFDKVAFVAVTGSGLPEDLRRTREAGFDAHLVKPVTLGTLRQVLERF